MCVSYDSAKLNPRLGHSRPDQVLHDVPGVKSARVLDCGQEWLLVGSALVGSELVVYFGKDVSL